jgi:hypothetical protein
VVWEGGESGASGLVSLTIGRRGNGDVLGVLGYAREMSWY